MFSIKMKLTQSDQCPNGCDKTRRQAKLEGREQGFDVCGVNLFNQMSLNNSRDVDLGNITFGLTGLEIFNCQRAGLAVAPGDFVNHPNSVFITALAHKILGRLVQGKEQESSQEHKKRQSAHGDQKVSPAHVVLLETRLLFLRTGEVAQKRPCDQGRNHLSNSPIDRQDGQQVLVSRREKFEENGRVDGQISANTKRPKAVEDANCRKVGCASSNHAPESRQAKGEIEGDFAAKDITSKAPKDGTTQEANVLCESQERRAAGREFVCDGREDERGDNGP